MSSLPFKSTHKLILPKPGDLYRLKQDLTIMDTKKIVRDVPKNSIFSIVSVVEESSMRLDYSVKYVAHWTCIMFFDRKLFEIKFHNSSTSSSFKTYFEPL